MNNPIIILKKELKLNSRYSIAAILNEYSAVNNKLILPIYEHNNMEKKYYIAHYIVSIYTLLMDVFNNNKVFNYNNRKKYIDYYDIIHYKFLLIQQNLLDKIQYI